MCNTRFGTIQRGKGTIHNYHPKLTCFLYLLTSKVTVSASALRDVPIVRMVLRQLRELVLDLGEHALLDQAYLRQAGLCLVGIDAPKFLPDPCKIISALYSGYRS